RGLSRRRESSMFHRRASTCPDARSLLAHLGCSTSAPLRAFIHSSSSARNCAAGIDCSGGSKTPLGENEAVTTSVAGSKRNSAEFHWTFQDSEQDLACWSARATDCHLAGVFQQSKSTRSTPR